MTKILPSNLSMNKVISKTSFNDANQNIQVFVRLRPLNRHKEKRSNIEVFTDRNEIRLGERVNNQSKSCIFDGTFDESSTQIQIYKRVVAPLINQVLDGYNCTVFAYGQTGTGKTYTMEGERSDIDCSWEEDPLSGIIPRALHQLFENISVNDVVRVSFLELYNEELYDLLGPLEDSNRLRIFEDASRKGSVIVSGLEEIAVRSRQEIYDILKKGTSKRQTAATLMNARSSRSHTIFSVTVHIKDNSIDGEELVKIGKLNLVDLAGSENIGRSGAIDKRAREAGNINQSLLTLGRVITSLVEKAPHIPYRESKLTRLLQDSLGGRTLTSIIATISPSQADMEDTISTLEYAQRAKKITNKPEVNQKLTLKTVLREFQDEIEKLRKDLLACRDKNGFMVDESNYKEMCQKMENMEANIKALETEKEKITEVFKITQETLETKENELVKTSEDLKQKEKLLDEVKNDLNAHIKVINIQEEVNLKLADQAKTLLEVADKSTGENQKLHEKIERQKFAEITNHSKFEIFQSKFQNELKNLKNRIQFGTESNNEKVISIKKTVDKNISNLKKQKNDIVQDIKGIEKMINEQDQATFSLLESKNILNELKVNKDQVNKKVLDALKETHFELYEEYLKFDKKCEETFELFLKDISKKLEFAYITIVRQKESFMHSIQIRDRLIMQTRERFTNIIDNQQKEIEKRTVELEELKSLHNKSCENFNNNLDRFVQFISNIKEEQSELKTKYNCKNIDSIKNHNGNIINLNTDQKDLVGFFDNNSSNMLKDDNENFEIFHCLENMVKNTIPSDISYYESCISKIKNDLDESINILSDKNIKNITDYELNVQYEDNLLNQLDENYEKNSGLINKTISNKLVQLDKILNSVENCEKQVDFTIEDINKEIENVLSFNKSIKSTYLTELNLKEKYLDGLKHELVKCDSTGNTPQKSTYDFPKEIKPLTPYHKVLKRFLINSENLPTAK